MKHFFRQLFCDNNSINEKSVVGFIAFLMMCLFACADIVTGFMGLPLVINEFIFNSFLILVLGSFAIGSVDKFINKKHGSESESEEETPAPKPKSRDTKTQQNSSSKFKVTLPDTKPKGPIYYFA